MSIKWAPSEWKMHQVGNILKKVSKPVIVETQTIYREIGIRSHGKGIFHKNETTGAEIGNKRVFWIEPDCFVVNIVFAWERAVAQTSDAEQGMIASHRFPMYKPVKGLLDLDFITYFFKSEHGNRLLKLASPGGAGRNKTLGQQRFAKLEIPLPPIEEQHKITEILGAWDEALTLTERLIEAKQKRKKGLMQQLLTGKVRFPGFEGEWESTSIGNICKTFSGGTPSRTRKEYFGGKIPWIKSGEINKVNIRSSEESITQAGLQNSSAKIVKKGTVLLALYGATAGKVGISYIDAAINQALLAILPKDNDLDSGFLFFELQNQMPHILRKLQGGQPNLSAKLVKNSRISVPYIKEQKKITAVLQACDDEITLLQRKAAALREQKKGLMQQLLTGKVRVKV